MITKAYIVGGGIFGSMCAHVLSSKGYDVTVFDSSKKGAGSKPAACLMKPSWMTSLDYKPPVALLDKLFGVEIINFKVKFLTADCFWVDPKKIMSFNCKAEEVIKISDGSVETTERVYSNGLVVVAAGVWCGNLLTMLPEIRSLCGSAVVGQGRVKTPTIDPYAPYRQAVWFNRGEDETWFGDGTSILKKNFSSEHKDKTVERAVQLAGITGKLISGQRPYIKGMNNGLFQKLGSNLYVSTGGAKNGTILAANNALLLLNQL